MIESGKVTMSQESMSPVDVLQRLPGNDRAAGGQARHRCLPVTLDQPFYVHADRTRSSR
jgi:hypothetical protein